MIPRTFHGYNLDIANRVSRVSVEATATRGTFLIRVERGTSNTQLQGPTLGPFPEEELLNQYQTAVGELLQEGYQPAGLFYLLDKLESEIPRTRALAALRLGWRQETDAVDKILQILSNAVDDSCSLVDSLGMIGDPRGIPPAREFATRKLLSRRRSGVEALRMLKDQEGLAEAKNRALERLPDSIRTALPEDENQVNQKDVSKLLERFFKLPIRQRAQCLDTLYELATPAAVAVVWEVIPKAQFAQSFLWRAIKSIYKRSQLRRDYSTYGFLSYFIAFASWSSSGTMAQIKSGYDGTQKFSPIFRRGTQIYLQRLSWRYLRDTAFYLPGSYAPAAAEVLIHYTQNFVNSVGIFNCYLLHQILLGGSDRFQLVPGSLNFRFKTWKPTPAPAGVREESYPELWDESPNAYLRLLEAALLPVVHEFALTAIQERHPNLIQQATIDQILGMLEAPVEATVNLGEEELNRRFDLQNPDWDLLYRMLVFDKPRARIIGQRWLRLTAALWITDADRIVQFLGVPQPNLQALVVEMVLPNLAGKEALRRLLAEKLLPRLRQKEKEAGEMDGFARLIREGLVEEFNSLVNVEDLANWITIGSPAIKVMAGELLRHRPGAIQELGMERLALMAQHELAPVRRSAQWLVRSALAQLQEDPSLLFILVESEWEDTQRLAFELLREKIDLEKVGLDGLMGLLDSTRVEVQDLGKELTAKYLHNLPGDELVRRLAEHPHPNMRDFALQLAVDYLPKNAQSLVKLKQFCRATLFDLWPVRRVKDQVIEFMGKRGLEDQEQAEVAAAILGDIVRNQTRGDFEPALEALVRIKLAYPELPTTVEIVPGVLA